MNSADFARSVGTSGPVWLRGHETRLSAPSGVRTVAAPVGITLLRADEMIVECGAGTAIDDLEGALAEVGQYVNLPASSRGSGTVGGALAFAHSDVRRLGRGAVRDSVLRIRFVGHDGEMITAGGSTVKNVSGFDLCRLLVGSSGSLGLFADVLLRTRPLPALSTWWEIPADRAVVGAVFGSLYRPAALLWNGETLRICLEGHSDDIAVAVGQVSTLLGRSPQPSVTPDVGDFPFRWSVAPRDVHDVVARAPGHCWAEIGVGTIHHSERQPRPAVSPAVALVERRLLDAFDPTGRFNPGVRDRYGATVDH